MPESGNAIAEFFRELYSARSERNEIVHPTWRATDTRYHLMDRTQYVFGALGAVGGYPSLFYAFEAKYRMCQKKPS